MTYKKHVDYLSIAAMTALPLNLKIYYYYDKSASLALRYRPKSK